MSAIDHSSKNCPVLSELPLPPDGKTGWPWTGGSPVLPERMPDGRPWPRLSIVTPSYNQAEFLEATIRSVLLQDYPNLEYIVIDGGSTDGSVEIIRKYERWIDAWVSEKDRGQSHAINKGFERASGELLGFINSDDTYAPNSFQVSVSSLIRFDADILIGSVDILQVDRDHATLVEHASSGDPIPIQFFPIFTNRRMETLRFLQPGTIWRHSIWRKTGGMDENYHYLMDRQWFVRALAKDANIATVEDTLANFTLHAGSKTQEHWIGDELVRAKMYLEFSNTAGFRRIPCLLESLRWWLRYSQDVAYQRYQQIAGRGRPVRAFGFLWSGRIFRRLRRFVDMLAAIVGERHVAKRHPA